MESCPLTAESESTWRTLGHVALKSYDLLIAERAFAAVGDVTRAAFVRECSEDASKLALLENDWSTFESNDFNDVIETYIKLHKWDVAVNLASRTGRLDVKEDLERRYFDWLLDTKQEAEAASLMDRAGNSEEALRLYLKSGQAVQASKLILEKAGRRGFDISKSMIHETISALTSSGFYEEAGQLYESNLIGDANAALENYVKGNAYIKAIELARREFPDEVVKLESKYAEWLLNEQHDAASAVSHFIEAGKTERALDAAIQAGQYERAGEIAAILDNLPATYGKKIGSYYASKNQIDTAVEIYLNCGCFREAITLLNGRGQFARAFKLAKKMMDPDEAKEMYASIAKSLEEEGKLKEAERIYITVNDVDSAISMYKNARQYDAMMKLVKQHHPDLVNDTHLHLAKVSLFYA